MRLVRPASRLDDSLEVNAVLEALLEHLMIRTEFVWSHLTLSIVDSIVTIFELFTRDWVRYMDLTFQVILIHVTYVDYTPAIAYEIIDRLQVECLALMRFEEIVIQAILCQLRLELHQVFFIDTDQLFLL